MRTTRIRRTRQLFYILIVLAVMTYTGSRVLVKVAKWLYKAGYFSDEFVRVARHFVVFVPVAANIGIALWLYYEAGRDEQKPWVWALFGLAFGVPALIVFMLLRVSGFLRPEERPK